jgi:hypothetical protein
MRVKAGTLARAHRAAKHVLLGLFLFTRFILDAHNRTAGSAARQTRADARDASLTFPI